MILDARSVWRRSVPKTEPGSRAGSILGARHAENLCRSKLTALGLLPGGEADFYLVAQPPPFP